MTLLRVATYNIHRCVGMDRSENPRRIAAVLREIDADIVALQELLCLHSSPHNLAGYLAEAAGGQAVEGFTIFGETGHYGNVVLTRFEVLEVRRTDISATGREPRGVLEVVVNVYGCRVALLATHLGLGIGERRRQTSTILTMLETTAAEVIILLGDFNEWLLWGRPLRWLKKWFVNAKAPRTFPSCLPLLRLDRIWVRPSERLLSLKPHITPLSRIASDHLPVIAEIKL